MRASVAIGNRVFAPSLLMSAITLVLLTFFVMLGRWQWSRGNQKQQLREEFVHGGNAAEPLGSRDLASVPRFQRLTLTGRYDGARQFLLDNRSYEGRAGYEVLTPFVLDDSRMLLVDRGWIASSGFRDRAPDVSLQPASTADSATAVAQGTISIRGRYDELPHAGLATGHAPPASGRWPKLTSYPTTTELAEALGSTLQPGLLLLDAGQSAGYTRAWQPPGMAPERHWSYAIQWWSFAVLLVGLFIGMNLRKSVTT